MVTIKDIAKKMGLGVSTVSMALNGHKNINSETRQRVLDVANELGYIKNGIAVDLQKKKTNVILLVVTDASRSHFSEFIRITQEEVVKSGYDLLIAATASSSHTSRRYISEHRVDGVIVYTNHIENEFLERYARRDFPIYLVGSYIENDNIYCTKIIEGYDVNTEIAIDYLVKMGHKKIAFVKASMKTRGSPRRLKTYYKAMAKHQLVVDEHIVFDAQGSSFEDGYKITGEIIEHLDEIDAICYSNDDIAIGGLRRFKEAGINVPEAVSVMGTNNLPESKLVTPALTTVHSEHIDSVRSGVQLLIKAIEEGPQDHRSLQKSTTNFAVIERDTVKQK